jgi:hypothetical protein
MKEQFVPLSIAEVLKQKGFNEPCMAYVYTGDTGNNVDRYIYGSSTPEGKIECDDWNKYDMSYSLPLWQQVIDWFRKKYNIIIEVQFLGGLTKETAQYIFTVWVGEEYGIENDDSTQDWSNNYEEVRQKAIEHALTLI